MNGATRNDRLIRFSVFELDRDSGELFKQGRRVKLQGQPFELLVALLEHPGEVLTREELRQRVWPSDTAGDFDHGLNRAINKIREALDDSADTPQFVETLPRRGYRFIGPIQQEPPAEQVSPVISPPPRAFTPAISETTVIPGAKRRKISWTLIGIAALLAVTAFWFLLRRAPTPPKEPTQEQLTFNSQENYVATAAISPDGRYLAYSDIDGIHIKLLSTSEQHLIPRPPGVSPSASWDVASWVPDGTQILANVIDAGRQNSMWTVSLLGESARELRDDARGFAISPDGTQVAFAPREPPSPAADIREIWVMGIEGDSPRRLVSLPEGEFLKAVHWSPDGKRLAYVRGHGQFPTFTWSMESAGLAGHRPTSILSDSDLWTEDTGVSEGRRASTDLCWLSDGRIIYSRKESAGTEDENLWMIRVDRSGAPITKPVRLTDWPGFRQLSGLSASADGKRLVLEKQNWHGQVYLGQLSSGGAQMSPPRRLTNDESDDAPTAWTADSKAVVFMSYRNGKYEIFKQNISQNTAEPLVTGPQSSYMPRLSPDGAWVLYGSAPTAWQSKARLMRVPVNGGSPQFVMNMLNGMECHCSGRSANVCVVLEASDDQKQLRITAFDPLKGKGRLLRTLETIPSVRYTEAFSPDGSTFAFAKGGEPETHIRLLSLSGAPDRVIVARDVSNITGLDWSADGKGFFCGSVSSQGSTLAYVDLNGNSHVLWQQRGAAGAFNSNWGIQSPDGRFLAIDAGALTSNAFMLENF